MPTLLAPAKINATLEVIGRRDDGYHRLRSVMLPVGLYDRIDLSPDGAPGLHVADPALAHDNLVERALAACGLAGRFAVTLHKRIPVGGGLGGGSSDAAAILRAAMTGMLGEAPSANGSPDPAHARLRERDWVGVARALGSDVPFFLVGTGALVEGTGERVTALGALPPWWFVIVQPQVAISTADAYRRLDAARAANARGWERRSRAQSVSLAAVDAIQRGDFGSFTAALVNDFHETILAAYPPLAATEDALRAAGAKHVLLSGSGACLFAPFEFESAARAAGERLAAASTLRSFTVPLHRDQAWRA